MFCRSAQIVRRAKWDDVDLARVAGCAVVFGRQETRIRALKKMQSNLASLSEAGRRSLKIVSVGAGEDFRGR